MAGHSKWANIQHRKKTQDARRGRLFTRLLREVAVATRRGGPDPEANARLRLAIDKAVAGNVPKDTIERAVSRAAGEGGQQNIEEVRYEGYGPGGVAVMVDCMTDNRNRTVSEVRKVFTRLGGNLGTGGSVAYLFTPVGQLGFPAGSDEEGILEAALEAGAEDLIGNEDGSLDVITTVEGFAAVRDAIAAAAFCPVYAEVTMRPATSVLLGREDAERMVRMLDLLEDLDDVQQVYSNADISEEILAEIG